MFGLNILKKKVKQIQERKVITKVPKHLDIYGLSHRYLKDKDTYIYTVSNKNGNILMIELQSNSIEIYNSNNDIIYTRTHQITDRSNFYHVIRFMEKDNIYIRRCKHTDLAYPQ